MQPDAGELLGLSPQIHLRLKEVGDGRIVKANGHLRAALFHSDKLLHQQWIVHGRDPEAADFRWPPA